PIHTLSLHDALPIFSAGRIRCLARTELHTLKPRRPAAGLFLSLAGQRKAKEPSMGIVRFSLRWPYTFYVLALLILFLGVTAIRSDRKSTRLNSSHLV